MKNRLMYFMLALLTWSYGQAEIAPLNEVPVEITGVWQSFDNDVVRISSTGDFIRIYDKKVAAEGVIVLTENGSLEIRRSDINGIVLLVTANISCAKTFFTRSNFWMHSS